jgi:hypothetical protein
MIMEECLPNRLWLDALVLLVAILLELLGMMSRVFNTKMGMADLVGWLM